MPRHGADLGALSQWPGLARTGFLQLGRSDSLQFDEEGRGLDQAFWDDSGIPTRRSKARTLKTSCSRSSPEFPGLPGEMTQPGWRRGAAQHAGYAVGWCALAISRRILWAQPIGRVCGPGPTSLCHHDVRGRYGPLFRRYYKGRTRLIRDPGMMRARP